MPGNVTRRAAIAGIAGSALAGLPVPARASLNPGYRSATDLVRALAARETTSAELTEAAISRIEALDPKINAVVVRDFARARAAAANADAALSRGERRPLLGVPMTVKEQFNIAGLPTTWGHEKFRDWKPEADALAVQRLKAAGAVIIGKTNVPADLADWQSYNEVYGTTNNPWDTSRSPGGSSGGAAAALAAGFVPLELGSDIGGSLRAPAHFCGIFSHKPSINLVPLRGAGPPATPARPTRFDLAVAGPMARSAADLRLALDVLAGPDPLWDGIGYKLDLPTPRANALAGFRVLVADTHPLCPTAAGVRAPLLTLADNLTRAGCTVLRSHPAMPDLARTTRVYARLLMAAFAPDLPADVRTRVAAAARDLPPEAHTIAAERLRGLVMDYPAFIETGYIRDSIRMQWQALFQDVDVLLCPPMPAAAFPHDHSPQLQRRLDVDGVSIPYNDQIAWAGIATLTGLPATTMPIGSTAAGLPVGMQVIGGYLNDATTLRFAELIEHEFGGFRPPPDFA